MNIETLKKIVKQGSQYASGGNSQPFRFSFSNARSKSSDWQFSIDYIAAEGRHTLVYEPHLILIALGFAAEYIRHAFHFEGINIQISFDVNDFDIDQDKQGICKITPSDEKRLGLDTYSAEVLYERVTNRNLYAPLSDADENTIKSILSGSNGRLYSKISADVSSFLSKCDALLWHSKKMALDMLSEASFKAPHYKGMPWRNLGTSLLETIPVYLIQQNPAFFNFFKKGGAESMMISKQNKLWKSSKGFVLFTLDNRDDLREMTLESMKMANLILALTKQGFHTQPSTLSTEVLNYPISPGKPNLQNTNAMIDMDKISASALSVRETLELDDKYVNWVLRIGRPIKPFPNKARTERLPVSELLTVND